MCSGVADPPTRQAPVPPCPFSADLCSMVLPFDLVPERADARRACDGEDRGGSDCLASSQIACCAVAADRPGRRPRGEARHEGGAGRQVLVKSFVDVGGWAPTMPAGSSCSEQGVNTLSRFAAHECARRDHLAVRGSVPDAGHHLSRFGVAFTHVALDT